MARHVAFLAICYDLFIHCAVHNPT